ncbi:MAG: DUF3105 domain-containing protein [Chloroflexi bacterium]|nr:DUF3105 domain-containing protein [Chloroflexota bacterium]
MSTNKKNNSRPSSNPATSTRRSGSPVEAARKSFVPAESDVATETPASGAGTVTKTSTQATSARQAARLERQRKRRRQQIITWSVVGVIVLAVVAGVVVWQISQGPKTDSSGITTFGTLSQSHVSGTVTYPQVPPVGGPHNQIWLNCGIYDKPVPNENAVHSLEHGAVWITYQPNLPADQIAQLQTLVRGQTYVILSPYTGLPSPVVASAWSTQLKLQSASDPRLASFLSTYRQGPQTPEPGAACSGGVGTPLQ